MISSLASARPATRRRSDAGCRPAAIDGTGRTPDPRVRTRRACQHSPLPVRQISTCHEPRSSHGQDLLSIHALVAARARVQGTNAKPPPVPAPFTAVSRQPAEPARDHVGGHGRGVAEGSAPDLTGAGEVTRAKAAEVPVSSRWPEPVRGRRERVTSWRQPTYVAPGTAAVDPAPSSGSAPLSRRFKVAAAFPKVSGARCCCKARRRAS